MNIRLAHRAIHAQPLAGNLLPFPGIARQKSVDFLPCLRRYVLNGSIQLGKSHHRPGKDPDEIAQKVAVGNPYIEKEPTDIISILIC
jgi:hypothetical protein